jgi:hypothetical protein
MMDDVELHESIAPLHYLYGTTLLYSIEEAKDGNDANAMTTINATVVPSGEAENQDDEEEEEEQEDSKPSPEEKAAAAGAGPQDSNNTNNPWAHLPSSKNITPAVASAAAAAAAGPEEEEEEGYEYYDDDAPQPSQGDDAAEDIQIAWENLEAARTIVERMVTLPGLSEHMESKLKL